MSEQWKVGILGGTVVSDTPSHKVSEDCIEYYGGYLIAESIPKQEYATLIAAAQDLLAALKEEHGWDDPLHTTAQPDCWKCAAIKKAEER